MSSLEKCLFSLPPFIDFFSLILTPMCCLYILEINPLLVFSFVNIFSHSEVYSFILLMISFAMQKIFKFNWAPFVSFCFYFHYNRSWH